MPVNLHMNAVPMKHEAVAQHHKILLGVLAPAVMSLFRLQTTRSRRLAATGTQGLENKLQKPISERRTLQSSCPNRPWSVHIASVFTLTLALSRCCASSACKDISPQHYSRLRIVVR